MVLKRATISAAPALVSGERGGAVDVPLAPFSVSLDAVCWRIPYTYLQSDCWEF